MPAWVQERLFRAKAVEQDKQRGIIKIYNAISQSFRFLDFLAKSELFQATMFLAN